MIGKLRWHTRSTIRWIVTRPCSCGIVYSNLDLGELDLALGLLPFVGVVLDGGIRDHLIH